MIFMIMATSLLQNDLSDDLISASLTLSEHVSLLRYYRNDNEDLILTALALFIA